MDSLTDTVSLAFLRELVDWAEVDPLLTRLADVKQVCFTWCGGQQGCRPEALTWVLCAVDRIGDYGQC